MRREVLIDDLKRLYTAGDVVRTDCGGCSGCHSCCTGMGESVILDPYDIFRMTEGLEQPFQALLGTAVELNISEGLILPNLSMKGELEACYFLNGEGRCSIHGFRPGICRLFPLGRYYENGRFSYFLQSQECPKEPKTKVKVKKWIGIADLKRYEEYILRWHYLLEDIREMLDASGDAQLRKDLSTFVLSTFYMTPYEHGDFYAQFDKRYEHTGKLLTVLKRKEKGNDQESDI